MYVAEAQRFSNFVETLSQTPPEAVSRGLREAMEHAKEAYFEAFATARTAEPCRQAIVDLGLVSLAQHSFNNERHYNLPFEEVKGWLPIARRAVKEIIDVAPTEREFLEHTVFFTEDPKSEKRLARTVSAAAYPGGPYDNYTFAAGVATGRITAQIYNN